MVFESSIRNQSTVTRVRWKLIALSGTNTGWQFWAGVLWVGAEMML